MIDKKKVKDILGKYGIDKLNRYDIEKLTRQLDGKPRTLSKSAQKDMATKNQKGANGLNIYKVLTAELDKLTMQVKKNIDSDLDSYKQNPTKVYGENMLSKCKNLDNDFKDKVIYVEYKKFITVATKRENVTVESAIKVFYNFINDELFESILDKYGASVAKKYKQMKAKLGNSKDYSIKMIDGKPTKVKKSKAQKDAAKKKSRQMTGRKQGKQSASTKTKAAKSRAKTKKKLGDDIDQINNSVNEAFDTVGESPKFHGNENTTTKRFDEGALNKRTIVMESGMKASSDKNEMIANFTLGKVEQPKSYDFNTDDMSLFENITNKNDNTEINSKKQINDNIEYADNNDDDYDTFNESDDANYDRPVKQNKKRRPIRRRRTRNEGVIVLDDTNNLDMSNRDDVDDMLDLADDFIGL